MRWEDVFKSRKMGGLGLVDMELKNKALLKKWVWQYGNELEEFWRRIIVKKA